MQSFARGLAQGALVAWILAAGSLVLSSEAMPSDPPKSVTDAVANALVPDDPAKVVVGAYINDI
jgi:hypothetical protein